MWIFNAVYMNMDTGKETIREIEFDGETMFEDDLERYIHATYIAYKKKEENEILISLELQC